MIILSQYQSIHINFTNNNVYIDVTSLEARYASMVCLMNDDQDDYLKNDERVKCVHMLLRQVAQHI